MFRTGLLATVAILPLFTFTRPVAGAEPPPKSVSFIKDVAPILKENCLACHDSKKKAGKFDLSTFEKLQLGGSNGEPIIVGKPHESELYNLVATTEERRMPPRDKGSALSKEKVAIIERWIKEGAKLDDSVDPKAELIRELRIRQKPPVPPEKYAFPAPVSAITFSRDGKKLVVGGHQELIVWELSAKAELKLVQRVAIRAERTLGLVFLHDGRLVAAGGRPGYEGDVRIFDLSAKPEKVIGDVAYLDGTTNSGGAKVLVAHLLDTDDVVQALALSADGKHLTAASDRTVRVWNVSGGSTAAKLEHIVENHADWILGIALSEDGRYLFTASRDKSAKVWDLVNKQSVVTFADHQSTVNAIAAGAGGKIGYSVGADRLLRSWKLDGDGRQLKSAGGHDGEVLQIAFSPKGSILATASADKTVRLWDVQKPDTIVAGKTLSLTDHAYSLAFHPEGTWVAAGSYDGEVRVWKVADGTLVTGFNASPGQPTKYVRSK